MIALRGVTFSAALPLFAREPNPHVAKAHPISQLSRLRDNWRFSPRMEHFDLDVEQNCGTTEPRENPSEAVIERMKIVFRRTHGAEMSQEDRNFLGIPPCTGECCP
jgi:hypothetical protein